MIRPDAREKLTGAAVYGTDLAEPGMLWGALVLAPAPHARIRRLDLDRARALAGVVAVVGPREIRDLFPRLDGDGPRPLFPPEEILYRNQPIAAVAATTRAGARAAARAVGVESDPLPVVADVESLLPEWPRPGGPAPPGVVAHVHARSGDVEAEFGRAEFVHSEIYRTAGVHQVALEPHACLARVDGDRFLVRTSTQTPFGVREDTAEILGLPEDRIVVEGTWVGGGFGGKGSSFLEPFAIALASATARPVKLALSHREEFLLGRTTLPTVVRIETAVKGGRMTARRVRLLLDTGASLPGRDFATGFVIGFLVGPYRFEAVEMEGYGLRTNKPPFGPHRAPLTPQCVFVEESHTDAIARRLGADPVEFRRRHVWHEGDTTQLGQTVGPLGLEEGLARAERTVAQWRRDLPKDHGIGVAIGYWSTGTGAGGEAKVRLGPAGLTIVEGEREIGSGSVVGGLVRVAERVTALPMSSIHLEYRNTADAPYDTGVFGSRTVGALGQAIEKACRRLLEGLADRLHDPGPITLAVRGGKVVVVGRERESSVEALLSDAERSAGGLEASGRHFGAPQPYDEQRVLDGSFYPLQDFTGTVAAAMVRVDRETGAVTPLRIASWPDVGVVLDPALVAAQIEGGVVMGLGTALTEEMMWGPDARLANPYFLDYRIPTLSEVPPIDSDPVEGFRGAGPFGAKGVGEPPIIPVPAAIANAVADATGARVSELPLTAERVARALKLL